MNKTSRIILAVFSVVLSFYFTARSQVQSEISIEELKRQIAVMERIERDPATLAEVRKINHELLVTRQAQLWTRLEKAIEGMRQYRATVASHLTAAELQRIDEDITSREVELESLRGAAKRVPTATALDATATTPLSPIASAGTNNLVLTAALLSAACPANGDDLINSAYLVASPGAPSTLIVELKVPLSLTQDPSITIVQPLGAPASLSQLRIPQTNVQIITQQGSVTHVLPPANYGPAETQSGFGRKRLKITLTGAVPAGDTEVRVALLNLRFDCASATGADPALIASASKSGPIFDENSFNESTKKKYDEAVAAAKSPDRKAFSAGFSAAKGDGENAQGAADLLINKTFDRESLKGTLLDVFDQASLSFQVKKSTADLADPRHLNLGLNFRKTFLVFLPSAPAPLTITGRPIANIESDMQAIAENVRVSRNKGFFRVLSVGGGLKFEGEAFDFKTVNFVTDPTIELGSIAKRIGSKGYYNFSILGGAELGRNLNKPTDSGTASPLLNDVNWIARLMGGGQFTLRYLPTSEAGDNWAVELNLAYVHRHLFHKEVFTDPTQNGTAATLLTIGEGNKPWREANLKFFLFGDEKARYGFKVTYMNGSLPPAFTPTRGFQYGFVVETTDDRTNGRPANQ